MPKKPQPLMKIERYRNSMIDSDIGHVLNASKYLDNAEDELQTK